MINIDFLTLKAFLTENIDFLIGSRLQKIQQPTRRDFILFLRNNAHSRKLYININPEIYHIAFMNKDNEELRDIKIPKQPPMFCMLLRKYLEGCRISDARVIDNERILELHFELCDEFAQTKLLCLAVELMGKHSNVILYDRETDLIIGCAHNVSTEKSRYRELKGGLRYVYPPKHSGIVLSNELRQQFKNLSEAKVQGYLARETFTPAIFGDKYTLFSEFAENSEPQSSVNDMLDNYYAYYQNKINLKNLKHKLTVIVNSRLKKNTNTISKLKSAAAKSDNTEKYKLYGELLTSYLYMKADYEKRVEVFDYVNGKNIVIELDETKTMNENAQRYFRLYTKSKTAKEKTAEMLNDLNVEREYLENIMYSIETAKSTADLADIESELGLEICEEKKKQRPELPKKSVNGFDVYIGKNNKQNDYIISKLSRSDDYWFHTKGCAGSHVLLRSDEKEPDEATIYECAKLARENSSAKQPSKVPVIYTKRKYIKKPPAAPLGYVIYKNEKEILV